MTGSLLPNGEQQFIDGNGVPYAGGLVYFYVPSTTVPKNTYQDPALTILNTNPVVLDSAGRAVIYGYGSYRQILKDAEGNTIWDQLTQASGTPETGTSVSITHANSPYTMPTGVQLLECDTTLGAITVNLYAPTAMVLPFFTIVKTDQTANVVTVNGSINGTTFILLPFPDDAFTFQSDLLTNFRVT